MEIITQNENFFSVFSMSINQQPDLPFSFRLYHCSQSGAFALSRSGDPASLTHL